jgi:hypothetical protein
MFVWVTRASIAELCIRLFLRLHGSSCVAGLGARPIGGQLGAPREGDVYQRLQLCILVWRCDIFEFVLQKF